MVIDPRQINATAERYETRARFRARNERLIREGRHLEVDSPERVEKFLKRNGFSPSDTRELLRHPRELMAVRRIAAGQREPDTLERVLGTNDLMGVAFLECGLHVSRSVGRIWISVSSGTPAGYGTGFLISPRLLMTNHHVLENKAIARSSLVEFNYQVSRDGVFQPTTTFNLEPDTFFFADQHLDYAVVAVRPDGSKSRELAEFGWNPLIEEEGKAIISQWLNIIQHPNGEAKQLALRENQLVDLMEEFLQYKTDTAPGSSGSPVYNDRWEVVGLHHSGVYAQNAAGQILAVDGRVWRDSMGEHRIKWISNEGVRISRIVAHLRKQPMDAGQVKMLEESFTKPSSFGVPARELNPPKSSDVQAARVSMAPDGTATWTIPLSVSVRLGDFGAAPMSALPNPATAPATALPTNQPAASDNVGAGSDLDSVLEAAQRELGVRVDVLNVRLGYVYKNGWITDERAIVVTVRQKKSLAALREANIPPLPEQFRGLPLEVTNPTTADLIEMARGPATAEAASSDLEVLREEITYTPPEGAPLNQITDTMRVIAHLSPDAGWPRLSEFLEGTRRQLTIGMYDFGAPHIVEALETVGRQESFRKLTLVMQKGESVGEGTKADDLRDNQVVERLSEALGDKFENAWVKIGSVKGWVDKSYHIKVAVRDQKALWLSSGNGQSSNQPEADPLGENPQRRFWLDRYNREWNGIVEHSGLAKLLERYLLHDYDNNLGTDAHEELDLPDLLLPESFFLPSVAEADVQPRYFTPFDEKRTFTVQPLLTPDNYHERVLDLVRSAQHELLIQNQTFDAPLPGLRKLKELVDAVLDRKRAGVRVRVIFRLFMASDARKNLDALKDYGFDTSDLKVQKNCHTKGIIVDRKKVLLGSQNWSNKGVSVNRDASLLFTDEPLAKYFAEIFDHDWKALARQNIGSESLPVEWVSADEQTPPGMIRLSWKDYMEMF